MQQVSGIMQMIMYAWPHILAGLLTGVIVWLLSNSLAKLLQKLVYKRSLIIENQSFKRSMLIFSIVMLVLSLICGFKEMVYLYLKSGNYALVLLVTLGLYGLLFIIPFYSLTIPFVFKQTKPYRFGIMRWVALCFTGIWLYMLIKADNYIYTDGAGVSTKPINVYWKVTVEILLVINLMIQTGMIAVFKFLNQKFQIGKQN